MNCNEKLQTLLLVLSHRAVSRSIEDEDPCHKGAAVVTSRWPIQDLRVYYQNLGRHWLVLLSMFAPWLCASYKMRGYHIRIQLAQRPHNSETFIPTSLFQDLPTHTPKSTSRKSATFNPKNKDYRFGPIRLDWVDLTNTSSSMNKAGKERESHRQGLWSGFNS